MAESSSGTSFAIVVGAAAGVEDAGIFHRAQSGFDGIEARAAAGENFVTGFGGFLDARFFGVELLGWFLAPISGAAVDDEYEFFFGGWGGVSAVAGGDAGEDENCGEVKFAV